MQHVKVETSIARRQLQAVIHTTQTSKERTRTRHCDCGVALSHIFLAGRRLCLLRSQFWISFAQLATQGLMHRNELHLNTFTRVNLHVKVQQITSQEGLMNAFSSLSLYRGYQYTFMVRFLTVGTSCF